MKICLLTRFFDFRNAGIGRCSQKLMVGLKDRGHKVIGISTDGSSLSSYFKYAYYDIRKEIPSGCDVYHACTPMEGVWIPKNKGIVTFHDLIPITNPKLAGAGLNSNSFSLLVGREAFRFACKRAARAKVIVCNSNKTAEDVIVYLGVGCGKVTVIRWGINDDLEPLDLKHGEFTIGYLGQLDRRKRVELLVEAFIEKGKDFRLIVGGTGPDLLKLRFLLGNLNNVSLLGFVPDNELCKFYNSLDVFVFPTSIEGYGLPIVEAMACKKPVVVLKDSIIPREVKDRCIVVDNLEESLKALPDLIKNVDLESNYRFAKEHSWDKCIDGYLKVYEGVVG